MSSVIKFQWWTGIDLYFADVCLPFNDAYKNSKHALAARHINIIIQGLKSILSN